MFWLISFKRTAFYNYDSYKKKIKFWSCIYDIYEKLLVICGLKIFHTMDENNERILIVLTNHFDCIFYE